VVGVGGAMLVDPAYDRLLAVPSPEHRRSVFVEVTDHGRAVFLRAAEANRRTLLAPQDTCMRRVLWMSTTANGVSGSASVRAALGLVRLRVAGCSHRHALPQTDRGVFSGRG